MTITLPGLRTIEVRTFPPVDGAFTDEVREAFEAARADWDTADDILRTGTARIRRHFPNATVIEQADLAHVSERQSTWYAYRDGQIRAENLARERLYAALASARRTTIASSGVLARSDEMAKLARFEGRPRLPEGPSVSEPPRISSRPARGTPGHPGSPRSTSARRGG